MAIARAGVRVHVQARARMCALYARAHAEKTDLIIYCLFL
jgi:NH3-dependent NAD+ synthetase